MAAVAPLAAAPQAPNDPLFQGLKTYMTTGDGAHSVTTSDLVSVFNNLMSQPGGKGHVEKLCGVGAGAGHGGYCCAEWAESTTMDGTLTFTKPKMSFQLDGDDISLSIKGKCIGAFIPWDGSISGEFYFNDLAKLAPGPVHFTVQTVADFRHTTTLHVMFYRNEELIADFQASNIAFHAISTKFEGNATLT